MLTYITNDNGAIKRSHILAFFAVAFLICVSSYSYFNHIRQIVIKEKQSKLAGIAALKADQIAQWRKERLADGAAIHSNPILDARLGEYLNGSATPIVLHEFKVWLESLRKNYGYQSAILYKTDGTQFAAAIGAGNQQGTFSRRLIDGVVRNPEVYLSDFHRDEDSGTIHLNLVIPVGRTVSKRFQTSAVLVLDIDPHQIIYPLIKTWPTESKSAEVILVERNGDEALYLNDARFKAGTALTLRSALTETERPSVRAALGQNVVFEGTDYRGIAVLAATRTIAGSPWSIVAKVDLSEIYNPIKTKAYWVAFLNLMLILGAGLLINLAWHRKSKESLREQEQFLRATIDGLSATICVVDAKGRIIKTNHAWNTFGTENNADENTICEGFNYLDACRTATEAEKVDANESEAGIRAVLAGTLPEFVKEYPCHSPYEHRWFICRVNPLHVAGAHYAVISHENITDRKQAEQKLLDNQQQLEELNCTLEMKVEERTAELLQERDSLNGILDAMHNGVYIVNQERRIVYANPALIHEFGPIDGRSCHEYLHGSQGICDCCNFREIFSGQTMHQDWMSKRTGKTYSTFDSPYKNTAGEFCKLSILHDISAQKITEKYIADYNKELEHQVKVRTGALENANYELTALNEELEQRRNEAEEAHKELQLVSKKYRLLFDNANDGIFIHDMQARILAANPMELERLGYSQAEMLSILVSQVDSPAECQHIPERMARLMEQGHLTFETAHLRKNGSLIPTEVSARLILWDGQPAVMSICRDITDRKRVKDELSIQKNQLQALMNHIPDLIWLKDVDGVYLSCNRKFERFFGAIEDDIVGKTDYDFVDKAQADSFRQNDKVVIQAGNSISNEEWLAFADDGQSILVETIKTPTYNSTGDVIGVLGIARDITERNQLDTSLKSSLSVLNATLESTADGILVVDLSGRITCWNQKFLDLWHIPEEIIANRVDKSFLDHVLSQMAQPAEFINEITELYGHPEKSSTDKLLFADGRAFRRYTQPQRIDDDIVGRAWSFHDITDSQMAEKELVAARDVANAANMIKSEFLSNMSHEIRTPLSAIIGFSDLALVSNLPPRQHDYVLKIQSAGEMLLNIVNDVLDFSKIEAGHLKMEQIPFRLDTIFANVITTVQQKALAKGLHLQVETLPEAVSSLIGDPHRLAQILINLLNNAVKFTKQGKIVFKAELLKQESDRLYLKFSILDTGIGLSAEQIDKLFHAFTQADSSTTRQFGGTGLGLSISKQLVELMGGKIWCESTPGQGSLFSFTAWFGIGHTRDIPHAVGDNVNGGVARQTFDFSGTRILLVEDNEINQQLAIAHLKKTGAVVDIAVNGEEAVAMITGGSSEYNLVLMDIQMPIMDGYEATRFIRADGRFAQLPIIPFTAHAMQGERQKMLEAGMNAYIAKPIDASTMFQVIKSFLHAEGSNVHLNTIIAVNTGREPEIPDIKGLDFSGDLNTLVDVAVVAPIFSKLLKYINGMDGKAERYLDDYPEELAGLPVLDIGQIKGYLNNFEYETAREALLALSARNGIILSSDAT